MSTDKIEQAACLITDVAGELREAHPELSIFASSVALMVSRLGRAIRDCTEHDIELDIEVERLTPVEPPKLESW